VVRGAPPWSTTFEKECNKFDLTALSVSDWPIIIIGPGGLLLVVPHLFAVPVLVLWVGLPKKYTTKLGCEKYVVQGHVLSTSGDALRKY